MSALGTRITTLQERFQDLLASMSSRDRTLFIGLVIGGVALLVGGSVYLMSSTLHDLRGRIDDREQTLQLIHVMAAEHESSSEQAALIEDELRKNTDTDLSAFLEKSAKSTGIGDRLDAVKEKSSARDGVLEEKLYAVSLSQLETSELAEFLYEIETAGFPLQIRSLKVKTRKKSGEITLRVDLDISAYRLLEDEGSEG